MKIYYSEGIIPKGYREMTDEEFRSYYINYLQKLAIKKNEIEENKKELISGDALTEFSANFGIARPLVPLQEGEKVVWRTLNGDIDMDLMHE